MSHVLTFCGSCPLGRNDVVQGYDIEGFQIMVTECMSGCSRPSTVAFRAHGKTAYLFGDITGADLDEIRIFAAAYLASADGTFADARIFGTLRTKAIARIPG